MCKVFFCGGDGLGWALDEDLRLIMEASKEICEVRSLDEADIVFSIWWEELLRIDSNLLKNKKVICTMTGEPLRYMNSPKFNKVFSIVGLWLVRSSQAKEQLDMMQLPNLLVSYAVDCNIFSRILSSDSVKSDFKLKYGIASNAYVIGSFQRDTEGRDMRSPKLVKGPDIFCEIVSELHSKRNPIHVVLAGPRRYWLKQQLAKRGIPFTYVGSDTDKDDIDINVLDRSELNHLYNCIDLYVVASRSEGGPHALLEATAAECKVISSYVGIAEDLLNSENLFSSITQAVKIIEEDILQNTLSNNVSLYRQITEEKYSLSQLTKLMEILLDQQSIDTIPTYLPKSVDVILPGRITEKQNWLKSLWYYIHHRKKNSDITIGLWHNFVKPPYGGGNQFMMALEKGLNLLGVGTVRNKFSSQVDAYIINSVQFPKEEFFKYSQKEKVRILHRIDGPISLIRGFDREQDDLCFEINKNYASATILQSNWVYKSMKELGYNAVNPTIVRNAVNYEYFHARDRIDFKSDRKIRLISSSWSPNVRKGGPIYKWLDEHLDWNRFEYTFVGQVSEPLNNIRMIAPVPSDELGNLLRQHDIFITASKNDPCSNAVIEALACGLPVLYLNSGGHPELVGYGGLGFTSEEDILRQLELLVQNYAMYQRMIYVPTLESIASKYLEVVKVMLEQ